MAHLREIDTNTIPMYVPNANAWTNRSQLCHSKTEGITTDALLFADIEKDDGIVLTCRPAMPTEVNIADALTVASSFHQGLPVINTMMSYLLADWASLSYSFELTNPLPKKVIDIIRSKKFSVSVEPISVKWLSLSPLSVKRNNISDKFYALKTEWEKETAFQSMAINIAMHPAYQQIIGMGVVALPLIFQQMLKRPAHWFWALRSITGEDPVLPSGRGDIPKMTEAWLNWGRAHSYL